MEEQRYLSMRENPRNLGLSNFNKPLSNESAVQKSMTPIVDRFKAMLKERDDELSVLADDDVPPPSTDEIVHLYELVLSELTFNSKPIITDLTIIAGEQREHGEGIADAICARIIEVPVDQKLPSLYLLDSIVKNIGKEYVRHFSGRLPEVFCAAYSQVNPNMHPSMRHLFGTWSTVFPPSVLRKIETHLKFSSSLNLQSSAPSESPRPTHGIHVNPKYLEARRQLEHSAADSNIQHTRGTSSSLKMQSKPPMGYDRYDFENTDIIPSQVGSHRLRSPGLAGTMSTARMGRSSSPYGIVNARSSSPSVDEFVIEDSPRRYDYQRGQLRDDTNGVELQRPRALIDAYGIDQGRRTVNNHKPPNVNGSSKLTWQNTEEEEFDWEDMSPTFGSRTTMTSDRLSSNPLTRSHQMLPPYETDLRRGNWSNQSQYSVGNGYSAAAPEDAVPSINSGRGLINNLPGLRTEISHFPVSHRPQESWNLPPNHGQRSGSNFQMPFLPQSSPGEQKPSSSNQDSPNPEIPSASTGVWPPINTHKSHPLPLLPPSFPIQKHYTNNQFNEQGIGNNPMNNPPQFPHQGQPQISMVQQQNFNHGYIPQVHGPFTSTTIGSNSLPSMQPTMQMLNIPNPSLRLPGLPLPPQPSVRPATSSQIMHGPPNLGLIAPNPPPGGALSGLFSSLMSQGLISLTKQEPVQDAVGLEFNADLLKNGHESAITALYADLPRQCTTCGLRFKCQEEHSSHMDWHVTKNRISKNRKQKPSRKWYVSVNMWLSTAESLGNDSVPGFQPANENFVEKKDDEEMAVPADEDQNVCALCGETFDDFYSDETEEWMYKGAVYMNAPNGSVAGMDRSQLGPIVHAKCRSESTDVSPEEFGRNYTGYNEEGSQRKRMKS